MRKIKICKKLLKLIHIDCSDMDCDCLDGEEFVAVDDIIKLVMKHNPLNLKKELLRNLNTRKQSGGN